MRLNYVEAPDDPPFSRWSIVKLLNQMAAAPVSPVRTRTTSARLVIKIFPSPTCPVRAALIIDANDPVRFFNPILPQFTAFFAAYAEQEGRAGRDRSVANRIEKALSKSPTWIRGSTLSLLIPSTINGNLELFTQTYALLVDLVREVGEVTYDFESVKEAWRRWSVLPDAYTQVGLNLIRIDRI